MLAKTADELPSGGGFLFEPKWDGFRAIVFRGDGEVYIQSRDLRPLDRYFPELHEALLSSLPDGCVVDGEIVIVSRPGQTGSRLEPSSMPDATGEVASGRARATADGRGLAVGRLDFDALQLRLHPAASRVAKLSKEMPASFVAFDLLAAGGVDLRSLPQAERRARLEALLAGVGRPVHLTPMTRERAEAADWLQRFEGAGLDGVIAKPEDGAYEPGRRAMFKIKHARTADCVVAGFRWHKSSTGDRAVGVGDTIGSLLLGLYDDRGHLHHVGVTSAFTMAMRKQLATELAPLRKGALVDHPWRDWAEAQAHLDARMPGGQSRWSAGKDLSWEPLRIERVCEVKYDHMQGDRFRHAAIFLRWRPDKPPAECRYDQLEITTAFELEQVFGAGSRP